MRVEILGGGEKLFSDSKVKSHAPVRYRLFKQLQLFAAVWDVHETNVIEEALLFCVTVLKSKQSHGAEKAELQELVEKFAIAA